MHHAYRSNRQKVIPAGLGLNNAPELSSSIFPIICEPEWEAYVPGASAPGERPAPIETQPR